MPGSPLPDKQKELAGTLIPCRVRTRLRAIPLSDDLRPPHYLSDAEQRQWWVFVNDFKVLKMVDSINIPAINVLAKAHVLIQKEIEDELSTVDLNSYFVLMAGFGGWPKARGNYRPIPDLEEIDG